MKILLANNFYYNRGGDCTYLFSLKKILEEKGHRVIVFSMHHPQNFSSPFERFFTSTIDYAAAVNDRRLSTAIRVISRTIYSAEAQRNLAKLIEMEKPDIAHLQNIHHHITPSIFPVLKKAKVPIIWTLHDYTVICPNTSFLCGGAICERCRKTRYWWPALVRCKKDSRAASLVAGLENAAHRAMRVYRHVDTFIAPSSFLAGKLIEYGFDAKRIVCLNNFLDTVFPGGVPAVDAREYLYVGRLAVEKGVKTLIDAAVRAGKGTLKIIGDGPLRGELEAYARDAHAGKRIVFLGFMPREEVLRHIRKSAFVVVPSEWYENYPFSVLEAFACGKPVIGANVGGIPEQVEDGKRGLLFRMGDAEDLRLKLEYAFRHPAVMRRMGLAARDFVMTELSGERHYERLLELYGDALRRVRPGKAKVPATGGDRR